MSITLTGRSNGLSVSLALRGVFGVFGRGVPSQRSRVEGVVEIGRGFEVVRGRDSEEIAALYFFVGTSTGETSEARGKREVSSKDEAEERGRLMGVLGIVRAVLRSGMVP